MKVDFIIPFVEAASSVCQEIAGVPPTRGELAVRKELYTTQPINIVCGVTGDVQGVAMLGFSKETAMIFARNLLHTDLRVFDQSVASALLDLGNKVSRQSSESLFNSGVQIKLTDAVLVRGMNINVPTFGSPILIVPLQFDEVGVLDVKLCARSIAQVVAA